MFCVVGLLLFISKRATHVTSELGSCLGLHGVQLVVYIDMIPTF